MKAITNIVFLALLIPFSSWGQVNNETTLVTSLNPGTAKTLEVSLNGDLVINKWDENHIRIVIAIKHNTKKQVIKALAGVGRYKVYQNANSTDHLEISMPGLNKEVKMKQLELEEHVSCELFIPNHIELINQSELLASTAFKK